MYVCVYPTTQQGYRPIKSENCSGTYAKQYACLKARWLYRENKGINSN